MNSMLPAPIAIALILDLPRDQFFVLMSRVIRVLTNRAPEPY